MGMEGESKSEGLEDILKRLAQLRVEHENLVSADFSDERQNRMRAIDKEFQEVRKKLYAVGYHKPPESLDVDIRKIQDGLRNDVSEHDEGGESGE